MRINVSALASWLRQTSTIGGVSTLVGVGAGIASGAMTWEVAVPVATGALVAMIMPGNSEVQSAVSRLATDAVALANRTTRMQAVAALGRDLPQAAAMVASSSASAPPVAVEAAAPASSPPPPAETPAPAPAAPPLQAAALAAELGQAAALASSVVRSASGAG